MRHFLHCWAEEVAGRGVEWGWRLLQVRAGCAGREVYLVARAAHDGREDRAGRVVAREAGLHQPGAVVAHQGGGLLVVAHLGAASVGSTDGGEQGGLRSVPAELASSASPEEGTGQMGVPGQGSGAGDAAGSLPLGAEGEWEEAAEQGRGTAQAPRPGGSSPVPVQEGRSPLSRSSPALYIFAFSRTGKPLRAHPHPDPCSSPSWREKCTAAGTPKAPLGPKATPPRARLQ